MLITEDILIEVTTEADIPAIIDIVDDNISVKPGDPFVIRFYYTLGIPKADQSAEFWVTWSNPNNIAKFSYPRNQRFLPSQPQHWYIRNGRTVVVGGTERQYAELHAIAPNPRTDEQADQYFEWVFGFKISLWQPTRTQHTGSSAADLDAKIKNLVSTVSSDGVYITWDLPAITDSKGVTVVDNIDIRISVTPTMMGGSIKQQTFFNKSWNSLQITYDFLKNIINEEFPFEPYTSARIRFQIKSSKGNTAFNRDDEELEFTWPIIRRPVTIPRPQNIVLKQIPDPLRPQGFFIWELTWQQPYYLLDTDTQDVYWLDNLVIDRYEVRWQLSDDRWTDWTTTDARNIGSIPSGQVIETVTHYVPNGTYKYQGRAVTDQSEYGEVIEIN